MFISTLLPHRRINRISERQWYCPPSVQRNKQIAQQFFIATWGQGNVEAVDHFTSPDFIVDYPVLPAPLERSGFKAWVADIHGAFPDLAMTINDVVAEGEKVVICWTAKGTNSGPIGFLNQPPPTKPFVLQAFCSIALSTAASLRNVAKTMFWVYSVNWGC